MKFYALACERCGTKTVGTKRSGPVRCTHCKRNQQQFAKHSARRRRWNADTGASAILGAMLVLGMMASLIPGLVLLKQSIADEIDANREAAQRAAWCARHPDAGPEKGCEEPPIPSDCTMGAKLPGHKRVYVCEEREA